MGEERFSETLWPPMRVTAPLWRMRHDTLADAMSALSKLNGWAQFENWDLAGVVGTRRFGQEPGRDVSVDAAQRSIPNARRTWRA
jgi:hypothetical protein